jgi:nitroimidazol reductase NimA-like FMN-containing flavoprotein (pyridoxamine 5'-phosphate oxidase superfamily)
MEPAANPSTSPASALSRSADAPSERTRVRRLPERGAYERAVIKAILDEGLVCHPFVIPTVYARLGDQLYLHGSPASRMLRSLSQGIPVCATVTLVDGLVLARSAFHHSMNYRSVVVLGVARPVDDAEERLAALRAIVEHLVPGRWPDVRRPDARELVRTAVLALPIDEASAKLRSGGPKDDEEDLALDVWAGHVPLELAAGAPVPCPAARAELAPPAYATAWRRPPREGD